jgi:hypothetical protein
VLFLLSVTYVECRYAECRYAECRYSECRYAECRGTLLFYQLNILKFALNAQPKRFIAPALCCLHYELVAEIIATTQHRFNIHKSTYEKIF